MNLSGFRETPKRYATAVRGLVPVCLLCASCAGAAPGPESSQAGAPGGKNHASSADAGVLADGSAMHSGKPQGPAQSDAATAGAPQQGSTEGAVELWYGGVALCGFTRERLKASASVDPDVLLSTSSLKAVSDVAIDGAGNAWVVGPASTHVFRFKAAALKPPAKAPQDPQSLEPDLELVSDALTSPGNLTFAADGTLWVANQGGETDVTEEGSIVGFTIPEGASGTQDLTPTVRITSATQGDLFQLGNIAFDDAGNLWATSFVGLLRFDDPAARSGDVALEPDAVIEKDGYDNNLYFYSAAFDANHDLWTASADGYHYLTSLTKFADPASLTGRSSPAAAVTIAGNRDVLPAGGLAFDGAGNIWMATGASLVMYSSPGDLSGKVDPAAAVTIMVKGDAAPSINTHLIMIPASKDLSGGMGVK